MNQNTPSDDNRSKSSVRTTADDIEVISSSYYAYITEIHDG